MTDISVSGTPFMSGSRVVEVLEECENFADTLKLIVSDLKQQGNTQRSLPSFPRSELLEIMGKEKPQKTVLEGYELHSYLSRKLEHLNDTNMKMVDAADWGRPIEEIIQQLESNYKILKAKKAVLFGTALTYGRWLDVLYKKLKQGRKPRQSMTFKKVLKDKIGISEGYARQLRILAKQFCQYYRLYYLSISIQEFWKRREQIKEMLEDAQLKQFWLYV